jgi:ABC-type transport system substrate-binding protein
VLAAGGSAGVAAVLLAACGGGDGGGSAGDQAGLVSQPDDTTKQAKVGGVMKDRHPLGDPPTLDGYTANNPWNAVGPHVYSTLVQFKPGYKEPTQNEIGPDLAESWEYSPDGLTITLKLRQGVKWHNKPPVNNRAFDSSDVVFTWDRFAAKSSSRNAVANAVDPRAPVLGVTALDARTVQIKLAEPVVYALGLFTSNSSGALAVNPKEMDTSFDPRVDMIGTGPWLMSNYTPSVGFTFKRNADYWDKTVNFIEQIDLPIMPEYTNALAQFKAGNIYHFGSHGTGVIKPEDVLPVKREQPRISVYQGALRDAGSPVSRLAFGWQPDGRSPFMDERVRQAVSMSADRDLFLDTFFNAAGFEAEGLPVELRWHSALSSQYDGWWLDPKTSDFGPNAKFFKHDIAEAKKLLAAAGFANGIEVTSHYIPSGELGNAPKQAEVMDGMLSEAGFTTKVHHLDYLKEYVPQYRDGRGQFEGWAYKSTAGGAGGGDPVGAIANEYWTKGGVTWHGFSTTGKNDQAGDPQVDDMIAKARVERDTEKRRTLMKDLQRYLAKPWYNMPMPGYGTGFTVAWPAVANYRVWQNARTNHYLWIDETKAPIART